MVFLRSEGLWLFGLVLVPLILYLFPLPRRRVALASTLVWQKAIRGGLVATRRRLWRVLGAIVLSALILALVISAFSRLVIGPGGGEGLLVIVMDNSASMQACDGGASRFERSRRAAMSLVEGSSEREGLALVTTAPSPRLAVRPTRSGSDVMCALRDMSCAAEAGSVSAGLDYVREAFHGARTHVFTDGAGDVPAKADADPRVTWHVFGGGAANAGIVGFGARRVESPRPGIRVQARIANASGVKALRELALAQDGVPFERRRLSIPADSVAAVTWLLPDRESSLVDLTLEPRDAFALDDHASAKVEPVGRRRVLLVSEKPPVHLLSALRADSTVRAFVVAPGSYRPGIASDLTIFTGSPPEALGPEAVLLVNPRSSSAFARPSPAEAVVDNVTFDASSAVVAGVAWRPGLVKSAARLETPAWADAVLSGATGPLIYAGTLDGRRAAVMGFDPETQPIARAPALPILVHNLVAHLVPVKGDARPEAEGLLNAGESDLRARLDAPAPGGLFAIAPAALWTLLIVIAIALLVIEAFLYHRQSIE